MQTKAKKSVYILSSVILAIIVFLGSLFFSGQGFTYGGGGEVSAGGSSGGGGEVNGGGETAGSGGEKFLFTVLTDTSQLLYLRQGSKGDYVGYGEDGFLGDTKYYLENPTDVNPLYYLGLSAENSGMPAHEAEIELLEITNDLLPYAATKKSGNAGAVNEKLYTVTYHPYNYMENGLDGLLPMSQHAAYTKQEKTYYKFVQDTYLTIPASLKKLLLNLASQNDIYSYSDTVITDVVTYIQNAASYDKNYITQSYPDSKDIVTCFLTEYKKGVCRHYAAAATMMFRALGIPARYAYGFAVYVQANEKLKYAGDGHAWTEIYLQGYGWIPLEVTGS